MLNMTPVSSSNIAAAGWSQETGLVVEFNSGAVYQYPDAPQSEYGALISAPSAGVYFSMFIRNRYNGERQ